MKLRVILFPEKVGKHTSWVAYCLDYDLVAQGATPYAAKASFTRLLFSHVSLCLLKIREKSPYEKRSNIALTANQLLKGIKVVYGRVTHME